MTATEPDAAAQAFDDLAMRLAQGEEPPAELVLVVVAAAGRTIADLQAACDRHAAELDSQKEE